MSLAGAPQVVQRVYDFLLYLIPLVSKFPKARRYTLGERLENMSLDVLGLLLDARYSQEKGSQLQKANVELDKVRFAIRLCKDLKLFSLHHYEVLSMKINEIGVQIGGWIRHQQARR